MQGWPPSLGGCFYTAVQVESEHGPLLECRWVKKWIFRWNPDLFEGTMEAYFLHLKKIGNQTYEMKTIKQESLHLETYKQHTSVWVERWIASILNTTLNLAVPLMKLLLCSMCSVASYLPNALLKGFSHFEYFGNQKLRHKISKLSQKLTKLLSHKKHVVSPKFLKPRSPRSLATVQIHQICSSVKFFVCFFCLWLRMRLIWPSRKCESLCWNTHTHTQQTHTQWT